LLLRLHIVSSAAKPRCRRKVHRGGTLAQGAAPPRRHRAVAV